MPRLSSRVLSVWCDFFVVCARWAGAAPDLQRAASGEIDAPTSSLRLHFDRDPTYVALVLDFMQYGEHQSLQSFRPPAAITALPPPPPPAPVVSVPVSVTTDATDDNDDESTSIDDLRNAIAATVEADASPVKAPPPANMASPPATRPRVPKISFGGVAVDQVHPRDSQSSCW
jgi:hypothetical protein